MLTCCGMVLVFSGLVGAKWVANLILHKNVVPKKKIGKEQINGIRKKPQIFEDEWNLNPDIVKSRLTNILGGITLKIYARKCQIKEVNSKDASSFCNQNHLMGKGRSNIRIGLYHDNVLVSLMTFTNNNLSRKLIGVWEINRFASLLDTNVVGGASRLFKHFLTQCDPTVVISYSDNRWSTGGLYAQLGFEKISDGVPNYWYVEPNVLKRIHRFTLRKTKTDNQELTEYQNRTAQGFTRVWDCGSSKWEWSKQLINCVDNKSLNSHAKFDISNKY